MIIVVQIQLAIYLNFIIAAASLFSWVISKSQVGVVISNAFINMVGGDRNLYLFALVIILLIVGCLMDNIAATLILAPILIPVGIKLGCNPLHVGMLFCICLVVGFVTPPFGYNLFTAISISGLNFKQVVRGTVPFLMVEIVLLFVFAYAPVLLPGSRQCWDSNLISISLQAAILYRMAVFISRKEKGL